MSTTTTTTTTTTPPSVTNKTADPSYIPRGPVDAQLTFYSRPADGAAPYNYVGTPPEGQPQRNFGDETHTVRITDIRGHEDTHTLDSSAFEALRADAVPPSATSYATFGGLDDDDDDDDAADAADAAIRTTYYPEVEKLLLSHLPGAHTVLIFDHTIRRSRAGAARNPVTRVHVDQTPRSTEQRVRHHLAERAASEEEISRTLRGRVRIVNVWRPLVPDEEPGRRVQASPLAVAASASVPEEDLVGVEHRYPNRTGETAGVRYNRKTAGEGGDKDEGKGEGEGHQWFYWSGMGTDERLLLKCADTDASVPGRRAPHTAFVDPRTPEGAPGRESIEVRTLVFG